MDILSRRTWIRIFEFTLAFLIPLRFLLLIQFNSCWPLEHCEFQNVLPCCVVYDYDDASAFVFRWNCSVAESFGYWVKLVV